MTMTEPNNMNGDFNREKKIHNYKKRGYVGTSMAVVVGMSAFVIIS